MSLALRRRLLFATLYFCEGAPIGLLWWALPAYWASTDVSVGDVTLITAVSVLPWSLKWLWAPLVDLTAPRWSYRLWIVAAQILMGLSILPVAWLDPQESFYPLLGLLAFHALAAATQDVAIDGMCIATIAEHERGHINGWMQAGMLLGRALFGGGALLLAAQLSLLAAVAALVCVLWSVALWLACWPWMQRARAGAQPTEELPTSGPAPTEKAGPRWAFLRDRRVWLALVVALVGGSAYESVGALLGSFLGQFDLSLYQIGLFQLVPLAGAMAVGALVGGSLADRSGHVRVAWWSLLALVGLNLALGLSADTRLSLGVIVVEYAVIGIFTASSYALFMDVASAGLKATTFSALTGATNACEAASGLVAGRLVAGFSIGGLASVPALGYSGAFIIMAIPSLLGLAILPLLRKKA